MDSMENITNISLSLDLLSFGLGFALALLVVFLVRKKIEKSEEDLSNKFKALSQEALNQSSESFLNLAQERLKQAQSDASFDLQKRQASIDEMVKSEDPDVVFERYKHLYRKMSNVKKDHSNKNHDFF